MKYVEACQHGQWHLHVWPVGEEHSPGTDCHRIPYACRSWRHEGPCREWRGALDWWRVKEGVETRDDWVYCVLTFRQPDDALGRWKTYLRAGKCWDVARKRLTRRYGRLAYVQTLERHKKGGCHVNVLLGNETLATEVQRDWRRWRREVLKPLIVAVGFGPVCWVDRCDDKSGALAGYLTKLADELTGSGTKAQIPEDAPPHFRRLRASRGLLPKKPEADVTGELVKCPLPVYDGDTPTRYRACGCHDQGGGTQEGTTHGTDTGSMAVDR